MDEANILYVAGCCGCRGGDGGGCVCSLILFHGVSFLCVLCGSAGKQKRIADESARVREAEENVEVRVLSGLDAVFGEFHVGDR